VETSAPIDVFGDHVQLGLGWGKGRRVIKTIVAGETLTRALERHQRWVDRQVVKRSGQVEEKLIPACQAPAPMPKYFRGARLQGEKLRMAKATLRGLGR